MAFAAFAVILLAATVALFAWASGPAARGRRTLTIRHTPVPPRAPANRLRIVTWNIGYASGESNNLRLLPRSETLAHLARMRQFLAGTRADLALLQECDYDARRSGHVDQAEILAEAEFARAAKAVNWDKRYVPFPYGLPSRNFGRIVSGQATLSRSEILAAETHVFAKPAENSFVYNAFYLDRLALACEIDWGGSRIVVVNVHLEAFVAAARLRQARELSAWLAAWRDRPLIVGGDFNAGATDPALAVLAHEGWLRLARPDGAKTFPSWQPAEDLDHLLVSPHFEVLSCEAADVPGNPSDHRPLVIDLQAELKLGGGTG